MVDTALISQPWATLADLPVQRPTLHDAEYEGLLAQASEILYAMSGRQFSGAGSSTVTLRRPPPGGPPGVPWEWAFASRYGWRPLAWGVFRDPGGFGLRVVALPDPPVTTLATVAISGAPVDYDAELPAGLLRRADGRTWPTDGTLSITYEHGIAPPIGGRQSAVTLAIELARSHTRDADCRLPRRIQTITRESVSIAFKDDFSSLAKMRTGIWDIDAWLASVNPAGITARASVWSPDLARARRIRG